MKNSTPPAGHASVRELLMQLGWLGALVFTFAVTLGLDAIGRLNYSSSLLFWVIPIAYLTWTFRTVTAGGQGRRRQALLASTGTIIVLGIVLDFLLGYKTLRFPDCGKPDWGEYAYCFPAVGGFVPLEEILFYALGPVAMVLVYACADEVWLRRYNPFDDLLDVKLLQFSPSIAIAAAVVFAALLIVWRVNGTFPTYAAFLAAGALLPAMFLYRCVSGLTNWPAFAVTILYTLVTSITWEVTLAIPRGWWGYEPSGMLGLYISAWAPPGSLFPIEAAFVWITAPFFTVLSYEFAKAFMHHPARQHPSVALFGAK
jgi:hypothetical protein